MRLSPLSLMGGSYADNSLTWSAQRTLNWLPETAEVEGTRTPIKFADIPGLRAVVDLGTDAPIRGLWNVEGKLFAVSSTSLFEISTSFGATNRGSIPGVTRVSMAHNKQGGATAANELVIANGLSGYVYNTSTNALVQITDEAFQGATTVDYVDGYITFTDPQGRFWGHSALNQATSFSSLDRYDAESAPDPIISHIVSHREVMVFGTRTIEFFRNTGAATGTFQRVDGTELEVGICSPFARSRVDNSVCWVSDGLEVFRLEGHSPQRISDRPIEQLLHTVNPANIFCFPWEDRGHKVFYITAPEAFTIGFDFASGMWHERQTFDLPRWRISDVVAWNGYWIAGDYTNGLLYVVDWDTHHENGLELIRERASGYTHGGQNKVLAPYVELLFDTGAENIPQPEISGDLPDGFVGDSGSGAYTVTGGTPPYGPITVLEGTPPLGFDLATDGTYTYDYTLAGDYSWTVGGTDAFGQPFSTPDTATVEVDVDPFWDDVVSLWRPTGTAGSTQVVDEKPVFWGAPDLAQKPVIVLDGDAFDGTALRFDAADIGDILFTTTTDGGSVQAEPFGMGTGDFTYEGFVTFNTVTGTQTILQTMQSAPAPAVQLHSGQWRVWNVSGGSDIIAPGGSAPAAGVRTFVQLIRNAGVLQLWVNGTMVGSVAHTFDYSSAQATYYGRQQNTANELDGDLEMWRITKGVARPTTVPVRRFPSTGP